ncbi:MAG: hypothetical protein AAF664_09315 [Planctomycetota bacterium]
MIGRKPTLIGILVVLPVFAAIGLYAWYRHLVPPHMQDVGMSLIEQELFNRVCIGTSIGVVVIELVLLTKLLRDQPSISKDHK